MCGIVFSSEMLFSFGINSSVAVPHMNKFILPYLNIVVRKCFKILYDKQVVGSVLALHGILVFDCDT